MLNAEKDLVEYPVECRQLKSNCLHSRGGVTPGSSPIKLSDFCILLDETVEALLALIELFNEFLNLSTISGEIDTPLYALKTEAAVGAQRGGFDQAVNLRKSRLSVSLSVRHSSALHGILLSFSLRQMEARYTHLAGHS